MLLREMNQQLHSEDTARRDTESNNHEVLFGVPKSLAMNVKSTVTKGILHGTGTSAILLWNLKPVPTSTL